MSSITALSECPAAFDLMRDGCIMVCPPRVSALRAGLSTAASVVHSPTFQLLQGLSRVIDVLCMGRSSIDLYAHEIGVPITGVKRFDAYVGGCPANVSVGTRRLGLRSALLTAVGTDQVGDFVLDFLKHEDVNIDYIPRLAERRTSAVVLTIQPPDNFPLTFYRDNCADLGLTIGHVRAAPLAESKVVFVSGTGLSEEPSRTATLFAAESGRRLGVTVVVDIDYR